MNGLINMSEYEKIVFVNGINESQNVETLSKTYPFVVFFANSESPDSTWTDGIVNIWKDGIRLTKFIGIDPNNCSIKIGGQVIKLGFNYKTGLLSLYEDINDLFIYAGYEYPTNDIINIENNIIKFSEDEIGSKIFWNWKDPENNYIEDIAYINGDHFYVAFPARLEGRILLKSDLLDKISNSFVNVTDYWFTKEYITLNNFQYVVYTSKTPGIFHGKIQ